jgi:replicative DNA helicase
MEMSDIQIAKRMVSAAGGMSMSRLKAVDKFEDEDWARFFNGMERMATRNIWITDATGLTIDQIQQTATRYQIAHPESRWWSSTIWRLSKFRVLRGTTGRWRSIQGA